MIVVFEGLDLSGKSTQIDEFVTNLEKEQFSYKVVRALDVSERTKELAKDILDEKGLLTPEQELERWLEVHREAQQEIRELELFYDVVILDRHIYSYCAMQGYAQGPDFYARAVEYTKDFVSPDLVFFLNRNPHVDIRESAIERSGFADVYEQRPVDFHVKIHEGLINQFSPETCHPTLEGKTVVSINPFSDEIDVIAKKIFTFFAGFSIAHPNLFKPAK